ncbi:MAG: hypothetical protein U0457_11690 [Candidatus Sericytochromatia bacterium]
MKKIINNFIGFFLIFLVIFNPTSSSYASEKNISNKIEFKLEKQNNFFENIPENNSINTLKNTENFNLIPNVLVNYFFTVIFEIPMYFIIFFIEGYLYNFLNSNESDDSLSLVITFTIITITTYTLLNASLILNSLKNKKNYSFSYAFYGSLLGSLVYEIVLIFSLFIDSYKNQGSEAEILNRYQELGTLFILPLFSTMGGVIACDMSYEEKEEEKKLTKEIEELNKNLLAFTKNIKITKNKVSYTILSF